MELRIFNLYYDFLKCINMEFESSKITAITGRSGSGKTLLLNILSGLILTDGVYLNNSLINKKTDFRNYHKLVGYIVEFPERSFLNNTVQKELEFPLKNFKCKIDDLKRHTINALKMVDLDESFLERKIFSLSKGEMRRVAIASVLVYNPSIIILDEPTIGLDNNSMENLIKILKKLKKKYNKNIIIASKNTDFLLKVSDYVYVINNGNVVAKGDRFAVFKDGDLMKKCGLKVPYTINFSNKVKEIKNINIGYRDDIKDLIKDIYRNVK